MSLLHEERQQVVDMIKSVDESIDFLQGLNREMKENFHVDKEFCKTVDALTDSDMELLSDNFDEFVIKYNAKCHFDNLKEPWQNSDDYKDKEFKEFVKYVIDSIKDSDKSIDELRAESKKYKEELHKITSDYFSYINSKEYQDLQQKKIDGMRANLDQEPDPTKRRKVKKLLDDMESAKSLDFLVERVVDLGKKEISNIVNSYFDQNRSALIMTKFKARMKGFGFSPNIYKGFFNIEENFLPEEYWQFNNLFLFHVMRTISYFHTDSDTHSLYMRTILIRLYNLVYHKFSDQESETEFIDFIRNFIDLFKDYSEKFELSNISSPRHPDRIRKNQEFEMMRREHLRKKLKDVGIDPEDQNLSSEELKKLWQDYVNEHGEYSTAFTNKAEDDDTTEEIETVELKDEITPGAPEPNEEVTEEPIAQEVEEAPQEEVEEELAVQEEENSDPDPCDSGFSSDVKETVGYVDEFGYYYVQPNNNKEYNYYSDKNEFIDSVDEITILRLLNGGNLQKVKISIDDGKFNGVIED